MFNVFGGRMEIALMIALMESFGLIEKITDFSEEFEETFLVTGECCEWNKLYQNIPSLKETFKMKYHKEVNIDYLYVSYGNWIVSIVILDK